MPITQSRILALLQVAEAYIKFHRETIQMIDAGQLRIHNHQQTPEQAYNDLILELSSPTLIPNKSELDTIYLMESKHFTPSRRRLNEKAARTQASKRGRTPRTTPKEDDFSYQPDPTYEEAYPESKTHCMACLKPLDSPYCGLTTEVLGSEPCDKGKKPNPNPSII